MARENYKEALCMLDQEIRIAPDADSLEARATAHLKLHSPSKTLLDVNCALEFEPYRQNLYLLKAQALAALGKFQSALDIANALITLEPNAKHYLLRSEIEEAMNNKRGAISDCQAAIVASEQVGLDAMDEVDKLKILTGKEVRRPESELVNATKLCEVIHAIEESPQKFHADYLSRCTGVPLLEIEIKNRQGRHSSEYYSKKCSGNFDEILLKSGKGAKGQAITLSINQHQVSVTVPQITRMFGIPFAEVDIPPSYIGYKRPWGSMSFNFDRHGFKSLQSVTFRTQIEPGPYERLQFWSPLNGR